jgi:hypothetical protein
MRRRMVGPFIFFDHMGPVDLPPHVPRTTDVRPHPHIGLSTVTYLFDGEIMHRDSTGAQQAIRPGAVNWMTDGCTASRPGWLCRRRTRRWSRASSIMVRRICRCSEKRVSRHG